MREQKQNQPRRGRYPRTIERSQYGLGALELQVLKHLHASEDVSLVKLGHMLLMDTQSFCLAFEGRLLRGGGHVWLSDNIVVYLSRDGDVKVSSRQCTITACPDQRYIQIVGNTNYPELMNDVVNILTLIDGAMVSENSGE